MPYTDGMHVLQLDPNHYWKAEPGCRILVVDNGGLRFDFPREWMVYSPGRHVFVIDRVPPENRVLMAISCRRVGPSVMALPMGVLLQEWIVSDERSVVERMAPVRFHRWPLEVAWVRMRVEDRDRGREVFTRICVARADSTHAIVTCDSLPEDEATISPVWSTVLKTLKIGEYIDDPTTGSTRIKRG
jgi:hypothetical protein